jgi:hypothetical protein
MIFGSWFFDQFAETVATKWWAQTGEFLILRKRLRRFWLSLDRLGSSRSWGFF